jgi:serine/threonine-protein kinase
MNEGTSTLAAGQVVGGSYELLGLLGKGGMGAVWRARHVRLKDKEVAIKVLLASGASAEMLARFQREAEIAARIGHPNIVDVVDLNTLPSGEPYIVLELLHGESLRDRLRRGPLPTEAAGAIARQIGSALHAAHRLGVVHRDLKPENVFLVPTDSGGVLRDHVKVLDFGISKLRGSQTVQTQEAVVLGTPQYMAPEQAAGRNQDVDGRTDIFALGAIVYEMLTGTPPFSADTPLGVMFKVVYEPTPPLAPRLPNVPAHVIAAIEKALHKQADARFQEVSQFVEALTGQGMQALEPGKGARRSVSGAVVLTPEAVDVDAATSAGELAPIAATDVNADTVAGDAPVATPAPAPPPSPPPALTSEAKADTKPEPEPKRRWTLRRVLIAAVIVLALAKVTGNRLHVEWDSPTPAPPATVPAAGAPVPAPPPVAAPAPAVVERSPQVAAVVADPTPAALPAEVAPAHVPQLPKPLGRKKEPLAAGTDPAVAAELKQAQENLAAGRTAEAARAAQQVYARSPVPAAAAVVAQARCLEGDLGGAQAWFRRLPAGWKQRVKAACARSGLEL